MKTKQTILEEFDKFIADKNTYRHFISQVIDEIVDSVPMVLPNNKDYEPLATKLNTNITQWKDKMLTNNNK